MTESLTGGCQCGAVRFRAEGPFSAVICHCRMCQKAFGGYFAPLIAAKKVEWTRGEPSIFRSSNIAERGFCAACGTPLFYRGADGSMEMAAGAFDDPDAITPTMQINCDDRRAIFDHLPEIVIQPNPVGEVEFNAKVVGNQHPDHDTETWPERR